MNTDVNLLPAAVARQQLVRRRVLQWAPLWIVTFAICAACCGWQWLELTTAQSQLAELERREAPARQLIQQVGTVRSRLNELQQRESLLNTLHSTGRPLQLIGIISQGAELASGDLLVERFSLDATSGTAGSGSKTRNDEAATVAKWMELNLEGSTTSDLTVASFVAAIEESGVFESVVLQSSTAISRQETGRKFKLVCRYR